MLRLSLLRGRSGLGLRSSSWSLSLSWGFGLYFSLCWGLNLCFGLNFSLNWSLNLCFSLNWGLGLDLRMNSWSGSYFRLSL